MLLSSFVVWCLSCASQGRRDLNPQPSVLETDALPVELLPSVEPHVARLHEGMTIQRENPPVLRVYGVAPGCVEPRPADRLSQSG